MAASQQSRWVISVASLSGVPIRIHTTFFFFFAWIVLTAGGSWQENLEVGAFVLGVFFCVLLHEFGHVLMARRFQILTKDITLYPFGGIALLTRMPIAKEEFWIAIAGPIVNILIASLLYTSSLANTYPIIHELIHTNIVIAIFNLIPAIPMDGGRVLRSILQMLSIQSATIIATKVSQVCSVLLAAAGFYFHSPMLVIIAAVVSMGAVQEAVVTSTKSAIEGKLTYEFMVERQKLYEFSHGTTLTDALPIALKALQDIFPVLYNDRLIGIIDRDTLIDAATSDPDNQYISSMMNRAFVATDSRKPLIDTMNLAKEHLASCLPVLDEEVFVGMIFPANVTEYMMVDSVRTDSQNFQQELDQDDTF